MLFIVGAVAAPAQVSRDPAPTTRNLDFDIREQPGFLPQDRAVATERLSEAGALLAAPPSEAARGATLRWNRFGLPQAFFHDRGPLTAPSRRDPEQIAREFLRSWRGLFRLSDAEIAGLRLTSRDLRDDAVFLSFTQTYRGIDVFLGQVKITLNREGQVVHVGVADVVPGLQAAVEPALSAEQTVRAAMEMTGLERDAELAALPPAPPGPARFRHPKGESFSDITAELVIFPTGPASGRLAWRIFLEVDAQHWYEILLDAAAARLLFRDNLYRTARGRVWRESPLAGPRELVDFPVGWLPPGGTVTTGNNVDAFVDANANDAPDTNAGANTSNGRASSATQDFDFRAPENPQTPQDPLGFKAASITHLFYFTNLAHDYFYALGFDEAAGNFQEDNFGRGGAGGDGVLAAAQYGAEVGLFNNSSFATTADGAKPRMRIYLFNVRSSGSSTVRDGAYDGSVILHEYAHGVSTRLVGARTNTACLRGTQSGALGEGWSDYFAASFFNNPVIVAYSWLDSTNGIRRRSYDGYRLTYEDLGNTGFEEHDDGEIWASVLWDLRTVLGPASADRLVVNGLKATPCNPTMVDARDAILAADQAASGGANRARIWEVYARHGLGFSASARDGSFLEGTVFTVAFDRPPDLETGNRPPRVTSLPPANPGQGDRYSYQIVATDPDGGQPQFELIQGASGMTLDANTGVLQWTASFVSQRIKIAVTDGQGGRIFHSFLLIVNTPLRVDTPVTVSGPSGAFALASLNVPEGTLIFQVTLREGTGDANLLLLDPRGFVVAESARGSLFTTGGVPSANSETLSIHAPRAGRWTAVVASNCDRPPGPPCRTFSDVVLTASFPNPTLLVGNATVSNLSGGVSSETFFRITVPPGASSLRVSTTGGTGTFGGVSLLLAHNRIPTCALWFWTLGLDCSFDTRRVSLNPGNNEAVGVAGPELGEWYVGVSGFIGSFSGVTLASELTVPPTLVLSRASMNFSAAAGASPAAQAFTISESTGAPFAWMAVVESGGANWLRVDRASGAGAATVQVSVVTAGLGAGTYRASITVTAPGLALSPQTVNVTLTLTSPASPPVLAVGAASLNFAAARGQDPAPQGLTIRNTGGGTLNWTVAAATTTGSGWLLVTPPSGTGEATIQVTVRAANLGPGIHRGTITITASGAGDSPAMVSVTLAIDIPVISAGGVVDAASFRLLLAPGGIASLFGSALANATLGADAVPLPTLLGGARVLVAGIPAPLFFVSAVQINFQVPFEAPLGPNISIVVERDGVPSAAVTVTIAENAPGIFTYERAPGQRDPTIVHADGRLVTPADPATAFEVLIVYATGVGGLDNPPPTGAAASASPLSTARRIPFIALSGAPVESLFTGLTPGLVGLVQFNIRLPRTLPPGARLRLEIIVGANSTQSVELAVR